MTIKNVEKFIAFVNQYKKADTMSAWEYLGCLVDFDAIIVTTNYEPVDRWVLCRQESIDGKDHIIEYKIDYKTETIEF